MSVFWTVLLCTTLFFVFSTTISVLLIQRAPKIEGHDPVRRPSSVSKRVSERQKSPILWTQIDSSTQLQRKKSEGTAAPRES